LKYYHFNKADKVNISFPLIYFIDVTAVKAKGMGIKNLGFLGTRYTASDGFYHDRIAHRMASSKNIRF